MLFLFKHALSNASYNSRSPLWVTLDFILTQLDGDVFPVIRQHVSSHEEGIGGNIGGAPSLGLKLWCMSFVERTIAWTTNTIQRPDSSIVHEQQNTLDVPTMHLIGDLYREPASKAD